MAKRYTDSCKWNHKWFQNLPLKMKAAWLYLWDNCDHAGFWSVNVELMSFQIGTKITLDEIETFFKDRIQPHGEYVSIIDFLGFQYGKSLNPSNSVHKSVIEILNNQGAAKPLARPSLGSKDKDTALDIDKEQGKEQDLVKDSSSTARQVLIDFNKVANKHFRIVDKNLTLIQARLKEGIKPEELVGIAQHRQHLWGSDSKMARYVRPETLYAANKVEGYLASYLEAESKCRAYDELFGE